MVLALRNKTIAGVTARRMGRHRTQLAHPSCGRERVSVDVNRGRDQPARIGPFAFDVGGATNRKDEVINPTYQELMDIRAITTGADADIFGSDPIYDTRYRVAETGAGVLGAVGTAVADIWEMKTGRRQAVSIDARHAAAALNSFSHLQR
jgi:hypothetical protein